MERKEEMLRPDDGFYFGLGLFETVAVEQGRPLFLKEHLERLTRGMKLLGIRQRDPLRENGAAADLEHTVRKWLSGHPMERGAFKLVVTEENLILRERKHTYGPDQYSRGLKADFSQVRRNSTSPLTYLKSLNYGDCILEKRKAREHGVDEPVFLNERGEIYSRALRNLFFVRGDGRVVTPRLECGLLPGVVRRILLEHGAARETVIRPEDLKEMKEAFLTNSLMGVMPVRELAGIVYREREVTGRIMAAYRKWAGSRA